MFFSLFVKFKRWSGRCLVRCRKGKATVTKTSKLYARIVADPRASIPFRDFERLIVAFGFTLDRTKGSHRIYKHPLVPRPLSIQPRGNMAKPYQVDQFLAMVQEFGLTMDE